jgi:cellulose synthase/poly-beta-1,6-N-acetylglucosamine synthase-like glycosyltransferase
VRAGGDGSMTGELLFWAGAALVLVPFPGYAAWVALRALLRPLPVPVGRPEDDLLPEVTWVMAAYDEEETIGRKLDALAGQDYPPGKIRAIVVSDGSTDATERIVARRAAADPRIRLFRLPRRGGKPAALNLARRHVTTEVMVLLDARQRIGPGTLRELVAPLASPGIGAVSGRLRVAGDSYWSFEDRVRRWESRSGSMVQVTGSLYAVRTEDFPEIPADTILDDVYVPLTIALGGRRIVMAERAESLDVATRTVRSEFLRKARTLAGLLQVVHRLPGCLVPGRNPVWGRFLVHKLARLACPYGVLAAVVGSFLASGWPYHLAFAGSLLFLLLAGGSGLGLRGRPARISRAAVAMNLAALWAVPSYLLGRASVTWTRVETDRT